ncbi:phospholipase [Mesobacillus foraminis]|uniref:phospholipase n=1 Tax=Mesobacillus foraminis TaxID=279826 RepID=UPI001051FF81|nr:phospholipase [Mesobacillus foraminis]
MARNRNERSRSFCIFPGYNWCGPGCSGPGAPINEVDSCCMKHDVCLSRGRSRCECDYLFMDCLRSKRNPRTRQGRHAALMYGFMNFKTGFTCRRW